VQVAWITQFPVRLKDLGDVSYISRVIASLSQISLPWQPGSVIWLTSFDSLTPKPPVRCKYLPFVSYASRVIAILAKISLIWQCGSVEVEFFLTSVNSRPPKPPVVSSLSDHAPQYLTDDIHLVSEGHRRRLRSSTDSSCAVPRTHNTFGARSFAVAQPRVWNSFQTHLRDEDIIYTTVSGVNSKLFCFNVASGAQWDFC